MARVFVGMSGGVDSSLAAALLQEQGHEVTGITLHIAPGCDDDGCCGASAIRDAKLVCAELGIPHYVLNRRELFLEKVLSPFLDGTRAGLTMNPCVACNEHIKFGALLDWCLAQGADYLATGHYARIAVREEEHYLRAAADSGKDQSYFLYRLREEQLAHVLFPLGELTKPTVRRLALEHGIHVAAKKDSQGVCFIPRDYEDFLRDNIPELAVPGAVLDVSGKVIGAHRGAAFYTFGQRRGGIRFFRGTGNPENLAVVARSVADNTVTMGPRESLLTSSQGLRGALWRPSVSEMDLWLAVRYHAILAPVRAFYDAVSNSIGIRQESPFPRIAPGQSGVLYDGDGLAVGGGFAI
jgi:tRNA-specific 2-thiouridylase